MKENLHLKRLLCTTYSTNILQEILTNLHVDYERINLNQFKIDQAQGITILQFYKNTITFSGNLKNEFSEKIFLME